jgi:hypothetical protein
MGERPFGAIREPGCVIVTLLFEQDGCTDEIDGGEPAAGITQASVRRC